MVAANRSLQARKHLDRRLAELGPASRFTVPRVGWLRSIREALGMSARALGQRLGVTGQAIHAMESSEADGKIQIETLRRAAEAMGCDLVYAIIPRNSLQQFRDEQAERIAREQIHATAVTMALEDQATAFDEALVAHHARELSETGRVWRDKRP